MDDWGEINEARDRALEQKELEALRNRVADKGELAAREALKGKAFPVRVFPNKLPKLTPGPAETRWKETPSGYPTGRTITTGGHGKDSEGTIP